MIQLIVQDSGTLGILTLRGNISRIHSGELRTQLIRGINRVNRLIVNCEQVASLDFSCLKLLCTAYRVSHIMNKGFILAGDRAALLRKAAGAAGRTGCDEAERQCGTRCLWTGDGPGASSLDAASWAAPDRESAAA